MNAVTPTPNTPGPNGGPKKPNDLLGLATLAVILVVGVVVAIALIHLTHSNVVGNAFLASGDIPAYRVLAPGDIRTSNASDIAWLKGVVPSVNRILGNYGYADNTTVEGKYYTLVPLNDSQAVTMDMLQKLPDSLANNAGISHNQYDVVCVPVPSTMALDGVLRTGDIVNVGFIQSGTNNTIPYNGLLVLDILKPEEHKDGEQYTLVLALCRPDKPDMNGFYLNMKNASVNVVTKNMTT
jgi:hypothetical protein